MSQAKNIVRRFTAQNDIRSKLDKAKTSLNTIAAKYMRDGTHDTKAILEAFDDVVDQIKDASRQIDDTAAKKHLDHVLSAIEQGMDAARAQDQRGIEAAVRNAVHFLQGTADYLTENPELQEKKEQLADLLNRNILPKVDKGADRSFTEAVNLCQDLAVDESPRLRPWFNELGQVIQRMVDARQDLRAATAQMDKMLLSKA